MKSIVQVRVSSEYDEVEDEITLLKKDIKLLNKKENLRKLILTNEDKKIPAFLKNFEFRILKDITDNNLIDKYFRQFNHKRKSNLEFLICFDYDIENLEIFGEYTPYLIEAIIKRFSLILNLSYNFPIDFLESITITDDLQITGTTDPVISDMNLAYSHAKKIGWPKLMPVKIDKVIESFKFNNYSLDGVSQNKYHRAVNSFSYNFFTIHESDTSTLFWNVLGLEALLAEGKNDIQNQIRVKSMLILGEPIDFKKKIGKLYDYRSRLIHGDIDFPAKFSSDYENFEEDYWDYVQFASTILLALIRKLVSEDKTQFTFEYKYML